MTIEVDLLAGFELDGGIQVRRAEVTSVEMEEREDLTLGVVEARLVPYERVAQLGETLWEVFTRGAFAGAVGNVGRVKKVRGAQGAVMAQGHGPGVIGHITELRDEDDALYGQLVIPDTRDGVDTLKLLRAGSLTELSLEFRPQKRFMRFTQRAGGTQIRHDKATLVGVSPVALGAYGQDARVLSVREAQADHQRELALARLSGLTAGPARA